MEIQGRITDGRESGPAFLSDEHSASSYGLPVLMIGHADGISPIQGPFGPDEIPWAYESPWEIVFEPDRPNPIDPQEIAFLDRAKRAGYSIRL